MSSWLARLTSVPRGNRDETRDDEALNVFDPIATWSHWDLIALQDELSAMIGRKVDFVENEGPRNPFRSQHILEGWKVIYVRP